VLAYYAGLPVFQIFLEFRNFDHQIGTSDIISKMNFFGDGERVGEEQVPINMLSVWMFNIKFVLLFGEIPTNRCFYSPNDFVRESNLSKSYVKEKA